MSKWTLSLWCALPSLPQEDILGLRWSCGLVQRVFSVRECNVDRFSAGYFPDPISSELFQNLSALPFLALQTHPLCQPPSHVMSFNYISRSITQLPVPLLLPWQEVPWGWGLCFSLLFPQCLAQWLALSMECLLNESTMRGLVWTSVASEKLLPLPPNWPLLSRSVSAHELTGLRSIHITTGIILLGRT